MAGLMPAMERCETLGIGPTTGSRAARRSAELSAGLLRRQRTLRASVDEPNLACQPKLAKRAKVGGQGRNRTSDTRIFSAVLYQLSYLALSSAL
jgi:hypothetical protein